MKTALMNTPWWVFGIFAYLIFIGVKSTKDRIVNIFALFIAPLIFMIQKYRYLSPYDTVVFFTYLISLVCFIISGFKIANKTDIEWVDQKHIKLYGSYYFLNIVIIFFFCKYYFGYQQAVNTKFYYDSLVLFDTITTAAFSGFLLGRSINFLKRRP
ncbi:MAG: hypothetical protein HEEMFOPI_01032 [Holosporales bacterium]